MATRKKTQSKINSKNFGKILVEATNDILEYAKGNLDLRETVAKLPSEPPMFSADSIKKFRKRYNLTQDILAYLLGVKPSAVKNWEQGLRRPSISVRRLFQIIEADPEVLLKFI